MYVYKNSLAFIHCLELAAVFVKSYVHTKKESQLASATNRNLFVAPFGLSSAISDDFRRTFEQ